MEKVIFDTNAYRYLASGRYWDQIDLLIDKIKKKERKNGIETLMSSVVAMELLAHVASKKDKQYQKCLNAIKAMYLHNGNKANFQMVANLELQIAKSFFNKSFLKKIETSQAIGQILFHLATHPTDYVFRKFQRNLNLIKNHVFESEQAFISGMKSFIKTTDPTAKNWRIFENNPVNRTNVLNYIRSQQVSIEIAYGWIYAVYLHLVANGEISLNQKFDFYNMSLKFIETFPEPIILQKQVLENMVNSEFDLTQNNRSNFLWDIQLMIHAGVNKLSGDRLYLVTSDDAMMQAAKKCGHHFSIYTFEEYMDILK